MSKPVLIVDDEPDLLELVSLTLSRMQLEPQTALNLTGPRRRLQPRCQVAGGAAGWARARPIEIGRRLVAAGARLIFPVIWYGCSFAQLHAAITAMTMARLIF